MTDEQIKELISKEVLKGIPDYGLQTVLRRVLFDTRNHIDWQEFFKDIKEQMPEYDKENGIKDKEAINYKRCN